MQVNAAHALSLLGDSGLSEFRDKINLDCGLVGSVLPSPQTLVAVVHTAQQIRQVSQGLAGAEFAHVMRAGLGAEANPLLVVLLDIGLLVPHLQALIFLSRAVDATAGATGVRLTLEETADHMQLANDASAVQ
jgi:hypothetical protein